MTNTKLSTTTAPPSKMALAITVAARVQIQSIRLIETLAKQSLVNNDLPTKLAIVVNAVPVNSVNGKEVGVCATFVLSGRYEEADTGEPPLRIQASFVLEYSLTSSEGLTKDNYDAFAELNGVHNVWPYWREYVQSVATRMGLPPLAIPVYRVVPGETPTPKSQPAIQPEKKSTDKRKPRVRSKKVSG